MLISHVKRFIYLKTVKTAGTSVEIFLQPECMDPALSERLEHFVEETESAWGVVGYRGMDSAGKTWFNHMEAARVRELVGPDVWSAYRKIAVIRDPFDKVVSWWWFVIADEERLRFAQADFRDVKRGFLDYLNSQPRLPIDRSIYSIGGELCIDDVIRYETLVADLSSLCERLSISFSPIALGRFKSDRRRKPNPFQDYYSPAGAAIVAEAYAFELERFGYSRPLA